MQFESNFDTLFFWVETSYKLTWIIRMANKEITFNTFSIYSLESSRWDYWGAKQSLAWKHLEKSREYFFNESDQYLFLMSEWKSTVFASLLYLLQAVQGYNGMCVWKILK